MTKLSAASFENMQETSQQVELAPEIQAEVETQVAEVVETTAAETTVTETVDETKSEQTTQAAETTTTETKENKASTGSFFDKFTKTAAETAETTEVVAEIPAEVKQELDSVKAELQKYKDSPLAKLLAGDYDISNVDIKELLSKAVGTDYSQLSDDDLIVRSLSSNPHFEKWPKEEQQDEIETMKSNFESMTKLQRLSERDKLISKLDSNDPSEIFKSLQEIQNTQKTLVNPDEFYEQKSKEVFETTFDTIKGQVSELTKQMVGQEYNGYKVTEDDAKATEAIFMDRTLNFDTDKVTFNDFKAATYDKAVQAAYERGKLEGIKEKANPSMGNTSGIPSLKKDVKGLAGKTHQTWSNGDN